SARRRRRPRPPGHNPLSARRARPLSRDSRDRGLDSAKNAEWGRCHFVGGTTIMSKEGLGPYGVGPSGRVKLRRASGHGFEAESTGVRARGGLVAEPGLGSFVSWGAPASSHRVWTRTGDWAATRRHPVRGGRRGGLVVAPVLLGDRAVWPVYSRA